MKTFFNRAPLTANQKALLSLGKIKPEGWLYDQLKVFADGITGKLDTLWADVGPDCEWLGGKCGSWERAPYYLDGLVALAYTLDDDALKAKAQKYIDWILASQREDGWFGPKDNTDYWPLTICLKLLYNYFTASGDKRVLVLMDKYFKYQYQNLSSRQMRSWAVARGGDNIYIALKLYNITGQKYLLELCKKIKAQTLDWTSIFHTFPNIQPLSKSMPKERLQEGLGSENELIGEERPFYHTYFHQSHGVNVAMGLKTPGIVSTFKSGFKEQGGFKFGWEKLTKYHGVANGIYGCDEHLNGNNPSAGTETCTVVELMYSLETLMDMGEFADEIPDILEKLAYNCLPACISEDSMSHQYLQQTNQIRCEDGEHAWYNNSSNSNTFGFAPNYVCCTANLHQGWPKFVQSLWYATQDEGLSAVSYAPCTVSHTVDNVPVKLTVGGSYPFGDTVSIAVSAKHPIEFPLYLRIPFWAENPIICLPDGEIMTVRAGEVTCLRQKWNGEGVIKLILPKSPRITKWSHQSASVEVGPLLMSMPLKGKKTVRSVENGCENYELRSEEDWAYALKTDEPMKVVCAETADTRFKKGDAPIKVMAKVCACPEWRADGLDAGSLPINPKCSGKNEKTIEMVPYGWTELRITQFPTASEE